MSNPTQTEITWTSDCGCQLYESGLSKDELTLNYCSLHTAAPDLLEACKLAKQHLDAMRLESGLGNVLSPMEKAAFEQVDAALTAAIAKAEGE